jgi:hypothetical protein
MVQESRGQVVAVGSNATAIKSYPGIAIDLGAEATVAYA